MVAKTDPHALGRVRLETRPLADLVPAPFNPRTISDGALAGLGESIGRFGLVQPIIVNARTGHVVGGHQRLKVLEAKGVETTDVIVIDVEETEESRARTTRSAPASPRSPRPRSATTRRWTSRATRASPSPRTRRCVRRTGRSRTTS